MVAHTGFEPVISALRGRCPRPLDECAPCRHWGRPSSIQWVAGDRGFEPRLADPESAVLPLDESPFQQIIASAVGPYKASGGWVVSDRGQACR